MPPFCPHCGGDLGKDDDDDDQGDELELGSDLELVDDEGPE